MAGMKSTYTSTPERRFVERARHSENGTNIDEALANVQVLTVTNISGLTDEQCNNLKPGNVVLKQDETGLHTYVCSYKKDNVGLCLTYNDAEYTETISYDYTNGHWVYNSKDSTVIASKDYVDSLKVIANPTLSGTEADLTGLEIEGVKYKVPEGGSSLLEDIVDDNGNARFVEGDLVNGSAGANITYKKWSLSGTHLMFVVAGYVNKSGTIAASQSIVYLRDLPSYIKNKIVTLNNDGLITLKQEYLYGEISGKTEMNCSLSKYTSGDIEEFRIFLTESVTNPSSARIANFRIQFDLLIDAE